MKAIITMTEDGPVDPGALLRIISNKIGGVILSEEDGVDDLWAALVESAEVEQPKM